MIRNVSGFLVAQESEDEIADALNILEDLSAYVGSFDVKTLTAANWSLV